MNCTKCGKEIPEGDKKVCDDCQKEVLKNIVSSENKKEEEKFKVSKNSDKEKKSSKVGLIVLVILLIIVGGLCYYEYSNGKISSAIKDINTSLFVGDNKIGNTIGNIRNYGYATIQKQWIYYLSPDEKGEQVGIFKIKTDGTEKQQLYMSTGEIISLNVMGEYVYYIVIDENGNRICKIKTDGTEYTVINDNEISNACYEIYVIGDSLYYIGLEGQICRMNLNGEERNTVIESTMGYLGITDKYIVYNEESVDENSDYITYIANLDGTNKRQVIEGQRLYSINIENDYLYYTNADKQICKVKIDDQSTNEVISDITAYYMNVSNGYIYYMNYVDEAAEDYTIGIYRIKIDEADKGGATIKTLESVSSFIDIVGDWIIYLDSSETAGFINLVKVDGSETVELYRLDFSTLTDQPIDEQVTGETPVVPEDETATDENVATDNTTDTANTNTATNTNTAQ